MRFSLSASKIKRESLFLVLRKQLNFPSLVFLQHLFCYFVITQNFKAIHPFRGQRAQEARSVQISLAANTHTQSKVKAVETATHPILLRASQLAGRRASSVRRRGLRASGSGGEDQREATSRRRTRILSAPNQPNPSAQPAPAAAASAPHFRQQLNN